MITETELTCPSCSFVDVVQMPLDACQHFYQCRQCKTMLKPKRGDCCVFCSFGSVKCPPKQAEGRASM